MLRNWNKIYTERLVERGRALDDVKRGHTVFVGSACAEPQHLVEGLIDRAGTLSDVQILHFIIVGEAPYTDRRFDSRFRHNVFFVGPTTRDAINEARADYTPVAFSRVPEMFRKGVIPIDVALVQTTPPDEHGFVNLGIAVDVIKAAMETAGVVIAQVNRNICPAPWGTPLST